MEREDFLSCFLLESMLENQYFLIFQEAGCFHYYHLKRGKSAFFDESIVFRRTLLIPYIGFIKKRFYDLLDFFR